MALEILKTKLPTLMTKLGLKVNFICLYMLLFYIIISC